MSIVHSCERGLLSTVLGVGREGKNGESRNDWLTRLKKSKSR